MGDIDCVIQLLEQMTDSFTISYEPELVHDWAPQVRERHDQVIMKVAAVRESCTQRLLYPSLKLMVRRGAVTVGWDQAR